MATIIAMLISIPLGTMSALFRDTWIDYVVRIITIGGLAIPSFWLGMLMILALLSMFNWLPPITYMPIYVDPVANLTQLIWPALAVGYRYSAVVARMMRSSLLEVLQRGLHPHRARQGRVREPIVSRHALRNALLPVDHRDRPGIRLPDRRPGGDRAGVQPQRHRPAVRAERYRVTTSP